MANAAELVWTFLAKDKASDEAKKVGKSFSDLETKSQSLEKRLHGLGGAGQAIAAAGIVAFGVSAIKTFAEVQDATSALEATYGSSAQAFEDFANRQAIAFNMSKKEALNAEQTFANFGKAAGLTGTQLETFSIDLTKRAADMASYYGGTTADAIAAVGAALRGEAEPARRYGVLLDDMSMRAQALKMGLIETTSQALTPQQKVLAANALILQQTSQAAGDSARTQGSLANQMKQATAQFENFQTTVGETLAVAVTPMLTSLNGLLNSFNSLPQPVKSAAVGFGIATAAAVILVPKIVSLAASLRAILPAGGQAAAGLTAEAAAAEGAGAASGAAAGKIGLVSKALGGIGMGVAATALLYEGWGKVQEVFHASADQVTGLADALARNDHAAAQSAAMANVNAQAFNDWRLNIGLLVGSGGAAFPLVIRNMMNASQASDNLNSENEKVAASTVQAKAAMGDYSGVLDDTGSSTVSFGDAVTKMNKELATSFDLEKSLKQASDELKSSLDALGGQQISLDGAMSNLYQSFSAATAAMDGLEGATKKGGTALDLSTEAGRSAQSALEGIAKAADDAATAQSAAGASTKTITKTQQDARAAFVAAAHAAGLTVPAAEALATAYGLVPNQVATEIKIKKDAEAKAKAEEVRRTVGLIPPEARVTTVVGGGQQSRDDMEETRRRAAALNGTTAHVTIYTHNVRTGGTAVATGGYISGPGSATSDSIPAMLSNGEYVIRAASVAKLGVGWLDDLNDNGHIDHKAAGGIISRYATGGRVSAASTGRTPRSGLSALIRDTAALNDAQAILAEMVKNQKETARSIAETMAATGGLFQAFKVGQLPDALKALADANRALNLANSESERADALKARADAQAAVAAARPTGANVLAGLKGKLAGIKGFYASLKSLKKKGLPGHLIKQLVDAGPVDGQEMAKALLDASPADLKSIIATDAAIVSTSASIGTMTTQALIGEQRAVVNRAAATARQDAVYVSSVKLQLDSREVASALLAYKKAMGNRPLGIS